MPTTPGLLHVQCSIADPALSDDTYNRWYNQVHIPEVLSLPDTPEIVLRYKNRDPTHQWQYLNLYTLDDISWTGYPLLQREVSSHHPLLPENKPFWKLPALDGRDYEVIDRYGNVDLDLDLNREGRPRCLIAMEVDFGKEDNKAEAVLNSYPPSSDGGGIGKKEDETHKVHVPRYLILHEFDSPEQAEEDVESMRATLKTVWELI
ncbi:hypothetical protein VTN77DRAFT_1245 [Rasamsonia byssochlamydoides]|uniref:uncharacterized protein n=1 Tax=Rasamsonia byssochlamydoides TaxID=89139 RepID=UPI0037447655